MMVESMSAAQNHEQSEVNENVRQLHYKVSCVFSRGKPDRDENSRQKYVQYEEEL